jgi:hypothetical protein
VVAYAAARTPGLAGLLVALGCLGGVLLLTVLARSVPELLAWAIAPAGVVYAISLFVAGGAIDDAAPLVATALLLCGELAAWSLDARWRISAADERVRRARAAAVGALALSGLAASAAVVAVAAAPAGTGLAWTTLGAAAAVGAVGVTVAVLRRTG